MTGRVDGQGRALLRVPVAATARGPRADIEAWVDTAFNGGLTMPRAVAADAVLADGSPVVLDSYVCYRTGSAARTGRRRGRRTQHTRCAARNC